MASSATIATPESGGGSQRIVRLWSDRVRKRQIRRLRSLRSRQFEESRHAGRIAWEQAKARRAQIPPQVVGSSGEERAARLDVPTPDVFALVLGVFRTGATLSEGRGDGKILELELSAQDLADMIGRSKSTVEAALRWLGCGPIVYHGVTYCRGLGWLHRRRRYGRAYLEGVLRWVFRTSSVVLTLLGRAGLGLAVRSQERRVWRRKVKERASSQAPAHEMPSTVMRSPDAEEALRAKQATRDDAREAAAPEELSAAAAEARRAIKERFKLD